MERNKEAAELLRSSLENEALPWITIDCSFNHIMTEYERTSLVVQIQESYSHLRRHPKIARMCVCSIDDELDAKIKKQGGNEWVIKTTRDRLEDVGSRRNLIVMSPDAEKELSSEDLAGKPELMFVIGGIVDRLVSRNETAHKAIKLGVEARRLPVDSDQIKNKVFNIDSVFHFLLLCLEEGRKGLSREVMTGILSKVLPERKKKESAPPLSTRSVKEKRKREQSDDPSNTVKLDSYRLLELFR